MGRLFGTDGVRGIANEELTPELALEIGKAGAYVLTESSQEKSLKSLWVRIRVFRVIY